MKMIPTLRSKSFKDLAFTFRMIIHFCVWGEVWNQFHYLACGHPVAPTRCAKKTSGLSWHLYQKSIDHKCNDFFKLSILFR